MPGAPAQDNAAGKAFQPARRPWLLCSDPMDVPSDRSALPAPAPDADTRLRSLPRRAYGFRILGMGLASLPAMAVLHEIQAGWMAWSWMVLTCFAWPHLAYLLATRSRNPFQAELRNFVLDSAVAGSLLPMLHFNLLPSAVLVSVSIADKIHTGVRGLWLRSLPGMVSATVAGGLLTGFAVSYATSTFVLLACLPIMMITRWP